MKIVVLHVTAHEPTDVAWQDFTLNLTSGPLGPTSAYLQRLGVLPSRSADAWRIAAEARAGILPDLHAVRETGADLRR